MQDQCTPEQVRENLPSPPETGPPHTDSPVTSLQPAPQPQCPKPGHIRSQPAPGLAAGPAASVPEGDKDGGQSGTRWDHCGACGHLLLALVLVVFSPLIAVGVCVADVVTGECCKGYDNDSDVDSVESKE